MGVTHWKTSKTLTVDRYRFGQGNRVLCTDGSHVCLHNGNVWVTRYGLLFPWQLYYKFWIPQFVWVGFGWTGHPSTLKMLNRRIKLPTAHLFYNLSRELPSWLNIRSGPGQKDLKEHWGFSACPFWSCPTRSGSSICHACHRLWSPPGHVLHNL